MREPIYLHIASNKVIDISEFNEIEWGIEHGQYKICCKSREDLLWRSYSFENEVYAKRFAQHFYGGPCEEAIQSIRKAIQV